MDIKKYQHIKTKEGFDALDALVLFEDVETKEITFKNKAYIKEVDSFGDKKPFFDRRFITIDSFLTTIDGRRVVVEVGEKVVPITNSSYNLDLRTTISDIENLKREEIHNDFFHSRDGKSKHDILLDQIVIQTINYYQSPYAHLFIFGPTRYDRGTLYQYELGKNDLVEPKSIFLNSYWDNALTNFFEKGFSILCENTGGFASFDEDIAMVFKDKKIDTIIMIPFFAESELIGLLMLANPKKIGDRTDLFLADYATNSIGSLIYRGRLYNDLYFDSITGFPWSNVLDSLYNDFIQDKKELPIVIMQFDIMHFRVINRSYGKQMGDRILKTIAEILARKYPNSLLSRKNDTDTFMVITTGIAENIALEANNIVAELRNVFSSITMYLSFGIYQVKDRTENIQISTLKVSFAHRIAREDPLNRIKIYDEELEKREQILQFYTNNFYSSLEDNKFLVYIQPRYNLQKKTYYGGEALVRWRLAGQIVPPSDFIPLFESNGLCRELDLYVLEKVCQTLARWRKESPENMVPISVNFSRNDFSDNTLFEEILFIINNYQIPTKYIEIEVTESAYVDFESQISLFLNKCRSAGIRVLMDDFGSGVSSFNSLKNLNIDTLKLDYKFLSATGDNEKKRKIIESIVSLARDINMSVIVEGVETKAEAAFFTNLGIRYVQGYLFGKPMPISEFEQIANKHAEFTTEVVSDTRFLLNEFLDTKSNLHLMINKSNQYIGVFSFDGKELHQIFINEITEKALSSISYKETFKNNGLLAFLTKEAREKAIECLKANNNPYEKTNSKITTLRFGLNSYLISVNSMFLKDDGDLKYFMIFANRLQNNENKVASKDDFEDKVHWLLSSNTIGCILLDSLNNVIEFNNNIKDIYPNIKQGDKIASLIGVDIKSVDEKHRIYNARTKNVYELEMQDGILNDHYIKILNMIPLGAPNKYITEFAMGGFKFYDRILSSMDRIARYYTEIDLAEDTFVQLQFSKVEGLNDDAIIRTGKYSDDYLPHYLAVISKDDRNRVQEYMTLSALNQASKSLSPFTLTYKITGQKTFFRISMKFYHDKGHYYACFFTEDISDMKAKDFDILTGCMSRNGGIEFINSYFKEHPIDKMTFVIVDLDKFKLLNDTYGHPLGDKVLSKIHSSFKKLPPKYAFSTRLGGDEFCIIIKEREGELDKEAIRKEIDDVLKGIGKEVGLDIETHCSCGLARFPEDGNNVEALYSVADKDLYIHKKEKKKKLNN